MVVEVEEAATPAAATATRGSQQDGPRSPGVTTTTQPLEGRRVQRRRLQLACRRTRYVFELHLNHSRLPHLPCADKRASRSMPRLIMKTTMMQGNTGYN